MFVTRIALAAIACLAAVAPASAFDCTKAKSAVEIAICANPDLVQSDLALDRAYQALRGSLDAAGRNALATSERRWVFRRDSLCGAETDVAQTICIARMQEERKHLLAGTPLTGPGGSPLRATLLVQQPAADRYEVDYVLLKFADPRTPGEQAFNREVERILAGAPMGTTANTAPEGANLSSYATMSLSYASPTFISAKIDIYGYEGGAHGNSGATNLNFDLAQGRVFATADVFDAAGQDRLFEECKRQIVSQKQKNAGGSYDIATDPNYSDATVRQYIGDATRWSFRESQTEITFDPYAVGSNAEGAYACAFDTRLLREAAGRPLPHSMTAKDFPDAMTFGRSLPAGIGFNILSRNVARSAIFAVEVLGATREHETEDFAVLRFKGALWMVHADRTYRNNALSGILQGAETRGAGVELRIYGRDPDAAEAAARAHSFTVLSGSIDKPHGLRECVVIDDDGYAWLPSVPLP